MKRITLVFLAMLCGCVRLHQIEMHTSTDEIRIAPERSSLGISSLTTTEDKTRQPIIDMKRSWAKKDGQRYQIATRRNEYVDSQTDPTPWTFEWVDLLVAKNGRQDRASWSDGEWELHLEYTDSSLRQPIDARFKLWTHSYNPIRDGAPN